MNGKSRMPDTNASAKPPIIDRSELLALIQRLARETLNKPTYVLTEDFVLGDASEWSSLLHIELMMDIEEALGIVLPLDDFSEVRTVGALIDVLIAVQSDA